MNDDDENYNDTKRYYGKFRGTVSSNIDPEMRGRIRVKVPAVLGDNDSTWALPSVPYAGKNVGLFLVPPVDALVWVEFEQGDPDYAIWTGCFWAVGEAPATPGLPSMKVLKTDVGTITINDQPGIGGVTIETTSGLKIVMDMSGIELSNGMQKILLSKSSVSVNQGALEVQ
jgi:uncharacterized protein involved in type VI secretion and phage assembly